MRNSHRGHVLLAALLLITLASTAAGVLYLWQTRQNPPTTPPSTVTVPPVTIPTDETANWETYKNRVYHYEFKYPAYLFVREDGAGIGASFRKSDNWTTPVSFRADMLTDVNPDESVIDERWFNTFSKEVWGQNFVRQRGEVADEININQRRALKITQPPTDETDSLEIATMIPLGKNVLVINFSPENDPQLTSQAIDQILATFKFLD